MIIKRSYRRDYTVFMRLQEKESYERELRNWNIYKDYKNGMEYFDLTSKYKLSVTTIRNITEQCQKKEKNGNNEEK